MPAGGSGVGDPPTTKTRATREETEARIEACFTGPLYLGSDGREHYQCKRCESILKRNVMLQPAISDGGQRVLHVIDCPEAPIKERPPATAAATAAVAGTQYDLELPHAAPPPFGASHPERAEHVARARAAPFPPLPNFDVLERPSQKDMERPVLYGTDEPQAGGSGTGLSPAQIAQVRSAATGWTCTHAPQPCLTTCMHATALLCQPSPL